MNNVPSIRLSTGAEMPLVGLGTWKASPDVVGGAVEYALSEAGYHHLDCAAAYENETEIGNVLRPLFNSGRMKRDEVFVLKKLLDRCHGE